MLRTHHIQIVRGSSYSFTRIARDEKQRAIDLTDAEISLSMRADAKVPATVQLTSIDPAPSGWRTGIVVEDQTETLGAYTVTFVPDDTEALEALGHDDPWIYDVTIKLASDLVVKDISTSNVDLYPQVGGPAA